MSLGVEQMLESTTAAENVYHEFMISTGKLPNHLFCFFEGKDNPYYVPRIKKHTNEYHTINCGGRSIVLEVNELIKNQRVYNKYKKAFFIDRDFNKTLTSHNPPIFETPCYSIENLYTSASVFKEILSNEFHLSETTNPLHQKYLELYKERQIEYHEATLLFNSWYACLISIRNTEHKQTGVQLESKFPKGLINFSIDKITQNYNLETLKNNYPNATEVGEDILKLKISEFKNCDASKTFRGKYEMEFLIKFINVMIIDAKQNQNVKLKLSSSGGAINNEIAISIFSSYAGTPDSLDKYLTEVLN